MPPPAPKAHQVEGVEWFRKVQRGLLADEPGLGKSRQAIEGSEGKTLIVAPSMVLNGGTWWDEDDASPGEIQKWADDPARFTLAPYSRLNPRQVIGTGKNGQAVYAPMKHKVEKEFKVHWDTLVLDESHYIKGRGTTWTKAIDKIAKDCDRVLAMTGTPIPNWAHESFTTLRLLHPDQATPGGQYGSFWRWAGQWFDTSPTFFSQGMPSVGDLLGCQRQTLISGSEVCKARPVWDPCEHWIDLMQSNFGTQWLRRLREDCLDLPPVTYTQVETPMSAAHGKIYRELKKDYLTHVDGKEIVAWNTGSKNVMLDKITISPWLLNKDGVPKGGKFDRLRWDLTNRQRPTLVVAHYQDVVEACAAVAGDLGLRVAYVHGGVTDRASQQAIRAFKRGQLDVLVGSLETVAEGLNLTVSDCVIFVEVSYKTYRNQQARQRVDRMGQTRPVTILEYLTPNSVDARKRVTLATKTEHQVKAMTAAEFARLL